jgi:hypothetical protein
MTKAVTYLPFEDALDRFACDTPRGAESETLIGVRRLYRRMRDSGELPADH